MNESLSVYLNLDPDKRSENEAMIERIDELLLTVCMKYSGIKNMYILVDGGGAIRLFSWRRKN